MNHKNKKNTEVLSPLLNPLAFWARHRKDTMAVIEGRIRPEVFSGRYGYLPRIVQRRLDRQGRRLRRRA